MCSEIEKRIDAGQCAEAAVEAVCDLFIAMFSAVDDEMTKQRATDVKDIKSEMLALLLGEHTVDLSDLPKDTVLVAKELTPSMTACINRKNIVGFITEVGSKTSHAAILARAMEIPAVLSVENATEHFKDNQLVIVDGIQGEVLTDPEQEYGPLRATGIALELLDGLLRETPRPCQPKVANLQHYYVDKSIRYIKAKYPQDISVEDVAQYCGLNRSYLGKLFRDATGITTQEYLIRQRMSVACDYLKRGAAPIATIARSVGYPNQLHFSRAFHKVFGIPPREWQKRNREK